ncbi:MAG: MBL fold metallo-hydrolase [Ruminococcaceae bacterium]|nr:MBL fold metallo-hydrolase [Oscillospiraceae bacterium]
MRRFLSLLLIGAILLCALASCKEDPTPPAASQEPSEQGGGAIALYNDQGVQCQLVYPNDAGETVMHAVERMQANFKELTGAELPAYAEASAPVGTAATIYFGNTWAAWDQGIPSDTGYYNYTVSIRNGNLYAYAMYEALLTELVIKLDLQFSKRFANGSLELEEGFSIFGTAAAYRLLSNVPYFDNADYHSTHDCDNGYEMVLIRNATAESFASYCQKLTAKGYTLAAENDMNGNLARTYFNADGVMLHTYLTPHSGEVRVIVANNPDYNSNPSDTNEKFQSFLRPLSADGGMGYLIRLGDGSFLVIDGGYDSDNCANEIYNLLKENAPDPSSIVISAWIFTHGHIDHVGAFKVFASKYASDKTVTIKSFVENMCLTEEQTEFINTASWKTARKTMEDYYPTVPVYVALTGQKLNFSNAEVEILYTMPDYMPNRILNESDATPSDPLKGNGNIQSVVFRVRINGISMLFMGDTVKLCCDEMSDRYGTYLKSDYVQMAHHGIEDTRPRAQNATKEIYGLIDPDYALLPCEGDRMSAVMKKDVNKYLAQLIGGEQNVICSGKYNKNIPLSGN